MCTASLPDLIRCFTPLMCTKCNKSFTSKTTLLKHQLWHHKSLTEKFRYNCEKCPYATNSSKHFQNHYLMHDPSRILSCQFCGNRFMKQVNLDRHILIHTGESLFSGYTCSHCEKWFSSQVTLSRHNIWHHKSDVKLRFNCTECPYATNKKYNLDSHSSVHRADRTHWCEVCGNGFTSASSLNKHIIIHTGEEFSSLYAVC
ncbi:UNVERIFIED_CONTAM: zinc finger protein [Trichonephila clavipes]